MKLHFLNALGPLKPINLAALLSQGRWNDCLANIGVYENFFLFLMLLVFYFVRAWYTLIYLK